MFEPLSIGRLVSPAVALMFVFGAGAAMSQSPPVGSADDLRKLKDDALLQQQLYQALKGAADARREYEASIDAVQQAAAQQAAATKAAKDSADAQTAAFNAQKARSDAELAALKAKYGDFSGSGLSGAVELVTGAGAAEAALLSAASLNEVAEKLATQIVSDVSARPILLATATTVPDMQAWLSFSAQHAAMNLVLVTARQSAPPTSFEQEGVKPESVAEVGLALAGC